MFASGNSDYWKKFESKDSYFSGKFCSYLYFLNWVILYIINSYKSFFTWTSKAGLKDPLKRREPYGESKLANICHMHELAKLNPEIGCFSLHPGVVRQELKFYNKFLILNFKSSFKDFFNLFKDRVAKKMENCSTNSIQSLELIYDFSL